MKKIVGKNTLRNTMINHNIRIVLGISMEMYAFLDAIEKIIANNEIVSYESIEGRIGLERDKTISLFIEALREDFIEPTKKKSKFELSENWYSSFNPEENEFNEFWAPITVIVHGQKKKISWTGSKYDARTKFLKIRKIETFEYLMGQKEDYFNVIAHSDWRRIMGCSVFLNESTKRYIEDWKQLLKDDDIIVSKDSSKKIDRKDVQELLNP